MIEVADAALRHLYQPRSLDPAARLFFSILIVTPACRENPFKKGNEGITFFYQGFSPYSSQTWLDSNIKQSKNYKKIQKVTKKNKIIFNST